MKLNKDEIIDMIDTLESEITTAHEEAQNAASCAEDASSQAYEAHQQAEYCQSTLDDAQDSLRALREAVDELPDEDEESTAHESSTGSSDLQKDIAKWKDKVLKVHKTNSQLSVEKIAEHFEIGTFLVSRILEIATSEKAA